MHALQAHDWPSNIRGLKNPIDNAAIRTPEDQWITPDMLFEQKDTDIVHGSFDEQVAQFEKKIIQDALEQTQGVIAHAAEMLSMDRSNQEGLPDYWGIETNWRMTFMLRRVLEYLLVYGNVAMTSKTFWIAAKACPLD